MDYASLESAIGLNWWDVDPDLQLAVRHHCPAQISEALASALTGALLFEEAIGDPRKTLVAIRYAQRHLDPSPTWEASRRPTGPSRVTRRNMAPTNRSSRD